MTDACDEATAQNWIDLLYPAFFGRLPDSPGRDHYLKALTAGTTTPLDFARALARSDEFVNRSLPIRPKQPALPLPTGVSRDQVLDIFTSVAIDSGKSGELENYAREDCNRFLYTLDLIPDGPLNLLEIGANPYFTSLLIELYRPQAVTTRTNYFGGPAGQAHQLVSYLYQGEQRSREFHYTSANVEVDRLPFADASFDVALYCEVIEHMTNDPRQSLMELKRVLKPQGFLILTTPNVARLENVARLIAGANIYDPYSGYGPYGRHNREYTRHELSLLLPHCGFSNDVFFAADVHENRAAHFLNPSLLPLTLSARDADLGQYLFSRWINTGQASPRKPGWLYRSYPLNQLDFEVPS